MPLKTYRPTSPGRREAAHPSFEEITRSRPEKSLLAPMKRSGGRNSRGKITVRHRGGGAKRAYRIIDFKRDKVEFPESWQPSSTTPTARPASPSSTTPMGINGTSSGLRASLWAVPIEAGPGCGDPPRECAALKQHPYGQPGPQRRDAAWTGRQDRPQRRCLGTGLGPRGYLYAAAASLRRGAQDPQPVRGHHWPGGQCRPQEHQVR